MRREGLRPILAGQVEAAWLQGAIGLTGLRAGVAVQAPGFEEIIDRLEPRFGGLDDLVVQGKPDRRGKIGEERLQPLVKQGQPVFHALVMAASRDRFIEWVVAATAEGLPVAAAEPLDRLRGEKHLADRSDHGALGFGAGPLRDRVEASYAL